MNIKDKLAKLKASKENFSVKSADGTEIEIDVQGLTFSELSEVAKYADGGDNTKAANYLLFRTFRKEVSEEEMSDDELKDHINGMSGKIAADILRKVREISGLVDEEEEKKD